MTTLLFIELGKKNQLNAMENNFHLCAIPHFYFHLFRNDIDIEMTSQTAILQFAEKVLLYVPLLVNAQNHFLHTFLLFMFYNCFEWKTISKMMFFILCFARTISFFILERIELKQGDCTQMVSFFNDIGFRMV